MCNPRGMDPLTSSPRGPAAPRAEIPNVSGLVQKLGIQIDLLGPDRTVVSMPVQGNTQVHGVLHGGATAALCETAASLAASAHAEQMMLRGDPTRKVPVGVQVSISHLYPARNGTVTARTKAIHLGHSSTVHEVTVTDGTERTISVALVTNRIIITKPQE